ncbi:MAG: ATP-binding cassette domain-containing protein [Burkholderiales bacterium]
MSAEERRETPPRAETSNAAPLRLDAVRLRLAGRTLVDRLDLAIAPGECVTLMGPSGCGKSTLLAFIAGSLDPVFDSGGRVRIGDEDLTSLPPERRRIGIQFQDDLLFPHLTVGGNLAFALSSRVRGRDQRRARVDEALAEADLAGFADRDPSTLSGGQRARVALMRALLSEPRALLLDEPFNRLDAQLRDEVRRFVFDHAGERAIPMLLVTHDEADARAARGRVLRFGPAGRVDG